MIVLPTQVAKEFIQIAFKSSMINVPVMACMFHWMNLIVVWTTIIIVYLCWTKVAWIWFSWLSIPLITALLLVPKADVYSASGAIWHWQPAMGMDPLFVDPLLVNPLLVSEAVRVMPSYFVPCQYDMYCATCIVLSVLQHLYCFICIVSNYCANCITPSVFYHCIVSFALCHLYFE